MLHGYMCICRLMWGTEPGQLSKYNYGLWDGSRGSIPGRAIDFPFLHSVQTGVGAQPPSSPLGTCGLLRGGKAAGA